MTISFSNQLKDFFYFFYEFDNATKDFHTLRLITAYKLHRIKAHTIYSFSNSHKSVQLNLSKNFIKLLNILKHCKYL